jgi:hypothetical protein
LTIGEVLDTAVALVPQDPGKRDRRREVLMRALEALAAENWVQVDGGRVRTVEVSLQTAKA